MVVRSVPVHSPANAASRTRPDMWIQALPRLYRITPTPCIDIDFGARPYFFYYSLCINYLLCNDFFKYHYYYYLRFALFFCTRKWSGLGSIVNSAYWHTTPPRLDGGLRQHFITPCRGLRHHSASLHWPCYVTASACRALRSATLGLAWGMEPCPASSSDCEHINQLSRFHAQSFNF